MEASPSPWERGQPGTLNSPFPHPHPCLSSLLWDWKRRLGAESWGQEGGAGSSGYWAGGALGWGRQSGCFWLAALGPHLGVAWVISAERWQSTLPGLGASTH